MGTSFHMQNFAFNNYNFYPVRIDSNILSLNLLKNINFNIFYSLLGTFGGSIHFQFCSRA